MKRLFHILIILVASSACSKGLVEDPKEPEMEMASFMHIRSNVQSFSSSVNGSSPVFIFWLGNEYLASMDQSPASSASPYFVSYPENDVNEYSTVPYNTERFYLGERYIYANGYLPSGLTPDTCTGVQDWTVLNVPSNERGYHNIMSAYGTISGNETHKLHENGKRLNFKPIQCRVNFYARLGIIGQGQYFRGVSITMDGKNRFTNSLRWSNNGTQGTLNDDGYIADGLCTDSSIWTCTDPNTNQMDPNEVTPEKYPQYRKIGTVYMHPGVVSDIVFDVEVITSDSPLFTTTSIIKQKDNRVVFFADNDTLKAQDEYDVLITINYDSIVLQGRKAEWEDGGKIVLPIYPDKN